jgi:hypothetical protein
MCTWESHRCRPCRKTHLQYVEGAPHVSAPQPYQSIHAASPQLHPAQVDTQHHTRAELVLAPVCKPS